MSKIKPYDDLTIMQQRFAEILFNMDEPNQTKAYELAGYKARGKTAYEGASRLARTDKVKTYLQYLRDKAAKKAIVNKAKVLKEVVKLAFTNISDYLKVDEGGNVIFIPFDKIEKEKLAAVESVKVRKNTTTNKDGSREYESQTTEFKLYNKSAELEKLMKHLGLYERDNAQKAQTIFDILAIVGINGNGNGSTKPVSSEMA